MRIAVASRDGRTVAGHIGKCAEWVVYEAETASDSGQPRVEEVARVSLPKNLVFHHYNGDGPHPLADCSVVIGASAGDSFVAKMARRGIEAVLTAEPDPAKAVADYVGRTVIPPKPRPIGGLICKIRDAISSEK
jgi:predicted Fe-Mo cluster-binding NifX family protein